MEGRSFCTEGGVTRCRTDCPSPELVLGSLAEVQEPGDPVSMATGSGDAETQEKSLLNEKVVPEIPGLEADEA